MNANEIVEGLIFAIGKRANHYKVVQVENEQVHYKAVFAPNYSNNNSWRQNISKKELVSIARKINVGGETA